MAEHQLTCRTCGAQFIHHRKKTYCQPECRPGYRAKKAACFTDCAHCGGAIPDGGNPNRKYCGILCSRRAEKVRRQQGQAETQCRACEVSFKPKGGDRTTFCSRECSFDWQKAEAACRVAVVHRVNRRDCVQCGVRFTSPGRHIRCKDCVPVYNVGVKGSVRQCAHCANDFVAMCGGEYSSIKFCSKQCQNAMARSQPSYKEMQKAAKARRRARRKGSKVLDRVSPTGVFERDGYRCGMCGVKTLKSKRGTTHPRAPELDHIVALSLGGDHSYANTQCSCRACNGRKGAGVAGQLNLFPSHTPPRAEKSRPTLPADRRVKHANASAIQKVTSSHAKT